MKEYIDRETFEKRTGLQIILPSDTPTHVVPLKDLAVIDRIEIMSKEYLEKLLHSTVLEGDPDIRPYEHATIEQLRIDPHQLSVGQTFVERSKYQNIVETLGARFAGFSTNGGFAKWIPSIVFGRKMDGEKLSAEIFIAHYVPPIIEVHNSKLCLIDGVHRNLLVKAIGTTIESIVIRGATPPPCDFASWQYVSIVDKKPPREERFINLQTKYFRNLGWVGIDG